MFELLVALPLLVKALILGVVEGLTEFLPISSTGHLILASSLLGFHGEKAKLFSVAIQTGAMVAVIVYFRARIGTTLIGFGRDPRATRFAVNVLIAFLPAAVLGLLFAKTIKQHLFSPVPVATAFIVGGLIIFGPAGLILGPVVFTVTRLLLQVWRRPAPEAATSTLGPAPD